MGLSTFSQLLPGFSALFLAGFRDRRALENFRNRQLRFLLRHACHVPYYRQLFSRAGVEPGDIRSTEDLTAIPISYKRDLQPLTARQSCIAGVDPATLIVRRSSGTTGAPSSIRRSWSEERLLQGYRWRALLVSGLRPSDSIGVIERIRPVQTNDWQYLKQSINAFGIFRTTQIDCFLPFSTIIDRFEKNRFQVIGGLTGTLYHTALAIIRSSGRNFPAPRFVFTGGEAILPHMRTTIETAFGAPVVDTYGSHEFNLLAWQCPTTGEYHLCDDSLILEVLKDGRPAAPGEEGEVVATSLFSRIMPFIRYALGDIAVQGADRCGCGAPFSTIREIRGRSVDYLVLGDGRLIHPFQIIRFIVHPQKEWVRQYQLIQVDFDQVLLRIVPWQKTETEILRQLDKNVRAVLGPEVRFDIELVDIIDREPSGKYAVIKPFIAPVAPSNELALAQVKSPGL